MAGFFFGYGRITILLEQKKSTLPVWVFYCLVFYFHCNKMHTDSVFNISTLQLGNNDGFSKILSSAKDRDDLRSRRSNDGNDDRHENAPAGFVYTQNLEQSPQSKPAPQRRGLLF
jgi:hypothetical protein